MIQSLKLFSDGHTKSVALFGFPSSYSDGWLENVPASYVFDSDYSVVEPERLYEISQLTRIVKFSETFLGKLSQPTRLQDLIIKISDDLGEDLVQVRLIAQATIDALAKLLETEQNLDAKFFSIEYSNLRQVASEGDSAPRRIGLCSVNYEL